MAKQILVLRIQSDHLTPIIFDQKVVKKHVAEMYIYYINHHGYNIINIGQNQEFQTSEIEVLIINDPHIINEFPHLENEGLITSSFPLIRKMKKDVYESFAYYSKNILVDESCMESDPCQHEVYFTKTGKIKTMDQVEIKELIEKEKGQVPEHFATAKYPSDSE